MIFFRIPTMSYIIYYLIFFFKEKKIFKILITDNKQGSVEQYKSNLQLKFKMT
jgi:hypothetical protein